jgi:replicative DNA helicase
MDNLDAEREKNPREIKAVILKNRHGETGTTIKFNYYAAYNYMEEDEESLF